MTYAIESYAVLAALWVLWCAIHSGMIWVSVTDSLKRRLGSEFSYYRLFYNTVAAVTLAPVVLYSLSIRGPVVFSWAGFLVVVQALLWIGGVLLFLAGARHYDLLQFLGFRQIMTGSSWAGLTSTGRLDTTGILGVTRHPWYLGAILLLWAGEIHVSTLVTSLMLSAYLLVGAILEERKLVLEFGDEYRAYQQRVSMLLPFKYVRSKIRQSSGLPGRNADGKE